MLQGKGNVTVFQAFENPKWVKRYVVFVNAYSCLFIISRYYYFSFFFYIKVLSLSITLNTAACADNPQSEKTSCSRGTKRSSGCKVVRATFDVGSGGDDEGEASLGVR